MGDTDNLPEQVRPEQESDAVKIARINADRDIAINRADNETTKQGRGLLAIWAGAFCLAFYDPLCSFLARLTGLKVSPTSLEMDAKHGNGLASKPPEPPDDK